MTLPFEELVETFEASRGLPLPAQEGLGDLVAQLGAGRRLRILDAGAGTGRLTLPLLARGHDVVALDRAAPMLARLRAKCTEAGPLAGDCRLIRGDVQALPFAPGAFDLVLVASLLYLVPDWRRALAEAGRVLQPGGAVLFAAERSQSSPTLAAFDGRWRQIIEATGYRHPPAGPDDAEVIAVLAARAAACEVRPLATWLTGQTLAAALDRYGPRLRPLYPAVADDAWHAAVHEFTTWAHVAFPDPATRLDCTVTFEVTIARGLT